jgi:hypothetical protein
MKKINFMLLVTMILFTSTIYAQDVVYAADIDAEKLVKINANPETGATSGNFSTAKDIERKTAAVGVNVSGYLYYLTYGENAEGDGEGRVDIYTTKADGTGSPVRIKNNFDLNGEGNDNDLGFVRLGIDASGKAWILAKSQSDNTLYLASFITNGTNNVSPTIISSNVTTSDNSNSTFVNGDLAFDGQGVMYVLANNRSTSVTKIYTINPTNSTVLAFKWSVVKSDGSSFTGSVNGAAFSSTGSMYISTSSGLYFIDQTTTNFSGTGTVKATFVKSQNGIADLATAYWPAFTRLPVRIANVKFKLVTGPRH